MIEFVEGNLLDQSVHVIGHQTNCLGVMGAGVAKQIKERFPKAFESYKELCDKCKDGHVPIPMVEQQGDCRKLLLGTTQLVLIGHISEGVGCNKDWQPQFVANIFGEYSFTEDAKGVVPGTHRHTDYDALKNALNEVKKKMVENNLKTLALPDHIGCGLAGGDWDGVVLPMIKEIFEEEQGVLCYIVKYKKA